jgi:hypothetical protein
MEQVEKDTGDSGKPESDQQPLQERAGVESV